MIVAKLQWYKLVVKYQIKCLRERSQTVVPDLFPQLTFIKHNSLGNSLLISLVEMDWTLQVRLLIAEPVAKVEVLRTCENKQDAHNLDGKSCIEKCWYEEVV